MAVAKRTAYVGLRFTRKEMRVVRSLCRTGETISSAIRRMVLTSDDPSTVPVPMPVPMSRLRTTIHDIKKRVQ